MSYLPQLRALLALNEGQPARGVELLEVSSPFELGTPPSNVLGFYGSLYPVYVRGLAYLAARDGAAAAREFQKILDHRGVVVNSPIGALANLQQGRAFAMAGNMTLAKTAYQHFLTLWKDADSDVPIFTQARAEYARLR